MWNKNVTDLDSSQLAEANRILKKYNLRVTDIASPLYKVDWPGAPRKKTQERDQFHADDAFAKQDPLLEHCIELTRTFSTDRIRCFDFWRIDDPAPYRDAINEKLRKAAETCAKSNVILLLENEMSCNTGTGEEAAAVLKAIPNQNFMLNWDPGNAGTFANEVPFPTAYDLLPKDRIGHCHAKNVTRQPGGKYQWEPVGTGVVDWVGQLRALRERWLPLRRQPGNPLARSRNPRSLFAQKHGRPEKGARRIRRNLLSHRFDFQWRHHDHSSRISGHHGNGRRRAGRRQHRKKLCADPRRQRPPQLRRHRSP